MSTTLNEPTIRQSSIDRLNALLSPVLPRGSVVDMWRLPERGNRPHIHIKTPCGRELNFELNETEEVVPQVLRRINNLR